jgi:hypothetical protein
LSEAFSLALPAKAAVGDFGLDCIEDGDDLAPVLWSAFGRASRVGFDGCLRGSFFSFHYEPSFGWDVKKNQEKHCKDWTMSTQYFELSKSPRQ